MAIEEAQAMRPSRAGTDQSATGKMTRRDLGWRAVGIASIGLAGCLKVAYDAVPAGTFTLPTGLASVFGFVCFVIACLGAVLLIHGVRVRDRWVAALRDTHVRRESGADMDAAVKSGATVRGEKRR